jgi:hypothetical protein
MKRHYPACERCGSDDVEADASVVWNVADQQWVISLTYETARCLTCDSEIDLIWKAKED